MLTDTGNEADNLPIDPSGTSTEVEGVTARGRASVIRVLNQYCESAVL